MSINLRITTGKGVPSGSQPSLYLLSTRVGRSVSRKEGLGNLRDATLGLLEASVRGILHRGVLDLSHCVFGVT